MAPSGLLIVDKPTGMTSRDVVNYTQRLMRRLKMGHAGTLDPLATGVLVVCVGTATRLIEYVQRMPKLYEGTFLLGRSSPTEDVDGEVTELPDPPVPAAEALREAAARLVGSIEQRPPAFSALKLQGQRAYRLARRGDDVQLAPRRVRIDRLDVLDYDYPELRLRILCGSGTYVRSLGRDLAESLGTAAVMSGLVRAAIGPFTLEKAVELHRLNVSNWTDHLLPPLAAVGDLPQHRLSEAEAVEVGHGRTIELPPPPAAEIATHALKPNAGSAQSTPDAPAEVAAVSPSGQLAAILAPRGDGRWGPRRNFLPAGD